MSQRFGCGANLSVLTLEFRRATGHLACVALVSLVLLSGLAIQDQASAFGCQPEAAQAQEESETAETSAETSVSSNPAIPEPSQEPTPNSETNPNTTPKELRWRFAVGDRFHLIASQNAKQTMAIGGPVFEIPLSIGFEADWVVDAVDEQGVASVTQTITRMTFQAKNPFLGEVSADTNNPPAAEDPHGLEKALRSAVGLKATFKAAPDGRTSGFQAVDEVPEALRASGPWQVVDPHAIEDLVGRGLVLPAEPVIVGANWTNRFTIPFAEFGKLVQDFTFTYVGPKEVEGVVLDQVDFRADLSLEAAPEPNQEGASFSLRESKLSGTAWFDSTSGHLATVSIRTTLTVAAEVEGMVSDAKSTVEGTTSFRRVVPE